LEKDFNLNVLLLRRIGWYKGLKNLRHAENIFLWRNNATDKIDSGNFSTTLKLFKEVNTYVTISEKLIDFKIS